MSGFPRKDAKRFKHEPRLSYPLLADDKRVTSATEVHDQMAKFVGAAEKGLIVTKVGGLSLHGMTDEKWNPS